VDPEAAHRVEVAALDVVAEEPGRAGPERLVERDELHLIGVGRLGDLRGDPEVVRRDDLRAVAPVDLVAVVLRRVVAGRHHHARGGAEVLHREGEERRRAGARRDLRGDPERGEHARGVLGELAPEDAPVVADDDAALARVIRRLREQVAAEAERRLAHHGAVHPALAAAEEPADPRGAELEHAHEALGELALGARIPAARSCDERADLGLRGGIGIVLGPALRAVEEGDIHGSAHLPPEPRGAYPCQAAWSTNPAFKAPSALDSSRALRRTAAHSSHLPRFLSQSSLAVAAVYFGPE
jgi:hypothetical protein